MTIEMIGRTLGPYTLTSRLGVGGMGEVYRAHDNKLGRDVAIKILPSHFTGDPERRARFAREARVLATLNHSHIGAIYGLEEADGLTGLVLELVEGETLSGRIERGPLSVTDALLIAGQIAEALSAAHEKGIVHRDLKPANVVLQVGSGAGSSDLHVKVLDFGLATFTTADGDIDLTQLPRASVEASGEGRILGTPAYMSPQQARGKAVDKRADIWAFGCVLYEMLTARQAFGAETLTDIIAAIIKNEPDWTALPADTPVRVRELLRRCVEKEPKKRLRDLGDASLFLDEPEATPLRPESASRRGKRSVAIVLGIVLLAVSFGVGWRAQGGTAPAVRYRGEIIGGPPAAFAPRVSPDGQMVAFAAIVNGLMQVGLARPQSGHWAVLTGDRDKGGFVQDVAWAPDASAIYFDRFADVPRGIYKVSVLGGEPRLVLGDAMKPEPLRDGSLLVVRMTQAGEKQLFRFHPDTGEIQALNVLFPYTMAPAVRAFPDGREAVFHGRPADQPHARTHLYAIDLASNRTRPLAPALSTAAVVPLTTTGDGREVLIARFSGDLTEVVALPRDGSGRSRVVMTVPRGNLRIDASADGTIYLDVSRLSAELLVAATTARPDRRPLLLGALGSSAPFNLLPLADGRVLVPTRATGRARVMAVMPDGNMMPFIDSAEETRLPMAMLGREQVALFVGERLSIVSVADGRVIRHLDRLPGGIQSLAGAPDGQTLFFVADGAAWAVAAAGGIPRRIAAAHALALDRDGRSLLVMREGATGIRLVRVPLDGGPEQEIPTRGDLRIASSILCSEAVGPDGRIIVQVTTSDSWYWRSGLLDPRSGQIEQLWPDIQGDVLGAWTPDGRVAAILSRSYSSLWRFTPIQEHTGAIPK